MSENVKSKLVRFEGKNAEWTRNSHLAIIVDVYRCLFGVLGLTVALN